MRSKPEAEVAAIATMVQRLVEEATCEYRVADHSMVDWCACCGVNLRLYDKQGLLFAKVIGDPAVMRHLAAGLFAQAAEMERLMPNEAARERLQARLVDACRTLRIRSVG